MIYQLDKKYKCWFIRGNREEYVLDYRASGEKGWHVGTGSGSLLYTYQNLTKKDFDFFQGLDSKGELEIEGYPLKRKSILKIILNVLGYSVSI